MLTHSFKGLVMVDTVEGVGKIDLQKDHVVMIVDEGPCCMDGCLSSPPKSWAAGGYCTHLHTH